MRDFTIGDAVEVSLPETFIGALSEPGEPLGMMEGVPGAPSAWFAGVLRERRPDDQYLVELDDPPGPVARLVLVPRTLLRWPADPTT